MKKDALEQLAATEVPPPPEGFDRLVYRRLNAALIVLHFAEFSLRAAPWAISRFGQAFVGFLRFTFTGSYERKRRRWR